MSLEWKNNHISFSNQNRYLALQPKISEYFDEFSYELLSPKYFFIRDQGFYHFQPRSDTQPLYCDAMTTLVQSQLVHWTPDFRF